MKDKIRLGVPQYSNHDWDFTLELLFPGKYEVVIISDNRPDVDLLVFDGGEDVSPSIYNAKRHKLTSTNPVRDIHELSVLEHYLGEVSIFGICRGHQFINAALAGSLIQHLPDLGLSHGRYHAIDKVGDSAIPIVENMLVVSTHHQSVNRVGDGFRVTAKYRDVVEGTENEEYSIRTVQFHPEYLTFPTDTPVMNYLLFRDVIGTDN